MREPGKEWPAQEEETQGGLRAWQQGTDYSVPQDRGGQLSGKPVTNHQI